MTWQKRSKWGPLIVSWWCARARRRACRYAKQISDGMCQLSRLSRWMPQVQAINLPLAFYMGWCKGLIWRPAARSVVLPQERSSVTLVRGQPLRSPRCSKNRALFRPAFSVRLILREFHQDQSRQWAFYWRDLQNYI